MPSVLIVDDSAFVRAHIKQIILRNGFDLAGEAENGESPWRKSVQPRRILLPLTSRCPR